MTSLGFSIQMYKMVIRSGRLHASACCEKHWQGRLKGKKADMEKPGGGRGEEGSGWGTRVYLWQIHVVKFKNKIKLKKKKKKEKPGHWAPLMVLPRALKQVYSRAVLSIWIP